MQKQDEADKEGGEEKRREEKRREEKRREENKELNAILGNLSAPRRGRTAFAMAM